MLEKVSNLLSGMVADLPFPYIRDYIPVYTPNDRRPARKLTSLDYITIHSTANERSTAKNERQWLTNSSNQATTSWHIVIDDKEAIEAIPLDEIAWHAGDGGKGAGNTRSIGIELCESGDRQQTINNAVTLVAKLLHVTNLPVDRVKQHYDWTGKNCPRILRTDDHWQEFLLAIAYQLQQKSQQDYRLEEGLKAINYLSGQQLLNNPDLWAKRLSKTLLKYP